MEQSEETEEKKEDGASCDVCGETNFEVLSNSSTDTIVYSICYDITPSWFYAYQQ